MHTLRRTIISPTSAARTLEVQGQKSKPVACTVIKNERA